MVKIRRDIQDCKEKKQLFFLLVGLVLIFVCPSFGQDKFELDYEEEYAKNITLEKINGVYIPVDVSDALTELDRLSSPEGRQLLMAGKEEDIANTLIYGLGKWMIVNWNFYNGSRLSHDLKQRGVTLPDDMALYLIVTYYRHLKGLPLQLEERAQEIYEKRKREQIERLKKNG